MMSMSIRLATRLSVMAALIEHLRWDVNNVPSTLVEIAAQIERSQSAVRRAARKLETEGVLVRLRTGGSPRYMLTGEQAPGAAQFWPTAD